MIWPLPILVISLFPKVSPKMNYLPCLKTPWSLVPRCHDTDNPYCLFTLWLLQQHGWIHLPHFSSDITTPTTPNSLISSGKNAPLNIHCFGTICLSISQKKKMHLPKCIYPASSSFQRITKWFWTSKFWHINFVESKLKKKLQRLKMSSNILVI